ncbi:hypothetical protein [Tenacibaculum ovolyticum]|uniref:hypothetical protein n=1 Tax=Tenacibaculum ovolyticum TaxID=104270 RepID=UPI003BAD21FC
MRQIVLYCIVLYCVFSCKRIEPSIEKPVFLKEKKDSVEQKFISLINKRDSTSKKEISFLERLSNFNKEELPFKFHAYLLDSLHNEVQFNESFEKLLGSFEPFSKINPRFYKTINITDPKKESNQLGKYYNLLFLKEKNDYCCNVSEEIIFKKLPKVNDSIEKFLTLTRFKDSDQTYHLKLKVNIVTYNVKKDELIDRKTIAMFGIGYENADYYEGFVVYEDSIIVKGYVYTEPELNIINKRFTISNTGAISEKVDVEVVDYE